MTAKDIDNTELTFGNYKGSTPEEVAKKDPSYIVWMYANVKPARCSKDLAIACEHDDREYEYEKQQDQDFCKGGW